MSDHANKVLEGEVLAREPAINLNSILNPFDPHDITRSVTLWREGMTVRDVVPTSRLDQFENVVSVNGRVIDPSEYDAILLSPDDYVVVTPVLHGGGDDGGSKNILRTVLMIVVVAVAVITQQYWAIDLGLALGIPTAVASGLIYAGVTMAGTALVNALLPVKPAQMSTDDAPTQATYGIDGPKNTSQEGMQVPVVYGKHRMAGNLIGLRVENVGTTQMLYMLFNAGEGPVYDISDLEINEQAISTFEHVQWKTRLGLPDQELIDWFDESFTSRQIGVKLPEDTSWFVYSTPGECDRIRLDFVAPLGIFQADKKSGSLDTYSVYLAVEYKPFGASDAAYVALESTADVDMADIDSPAESTFEFEDPNGSGATLTGVQKGTSQIVAHKADLVISDKSRSSVRRSFTTPTLENGRYTIRIKRLMPESTDEYISDKVYISEVNEVVAAKVAYNNTALVALKIKLTDQLNGMPNVTYVNHGRVIKVWDRASRTWVYRNSSNPAWHVLDALTHKRYGGQLAENRIDIEAFKEWAKFCDDNGFVFNGVLDASMALWDAMQLIARLGHAQLIQVGTRYSVAIERADTPVMMFTVGNMVKGTFRVNWLGLAERANEIAVTYFDELDKNKPKTIKIYDPAALTEGRPQRTAAITLYGCVQEMQAVKEGALHLNLNRYVLQTCEFDAPVEALACTVGSLVYLQHDMPSWEQSGRLAAGSTSTVIQFDRPIDILTGQSYKFLTLFNSANVGSGTVSAVDSTNGYLQLSAALPASFKRINVGGRDRACQKAHSNSGNFVWVEDTTGISVGGAYTLIDTDVVVEADVVNPGTGSYTQLTLTSALTQGAPAEFAHFMIGPVTKVKRKFRVRNITLGGSEFTRHLVCVQYDDRIYDIDTSGYNGPGGPIGGGGEVGFALSNVTELAVFEEVFVSAAQVKNRVNLTWHPPVYGIYKGADVWVSVNGEPIRMIESVVTGNRFSMDADVGSIIDFKVVAFDMFDRRVPIADAPTLQYIVTGIATNPPEVNPPTGLFINWAGRDCTLYWRYNSQNNSYEIGSEPYGADSGFIDPSVLDYEVRVFQNTNGNNYNSPTWTYVRTEYVMHPWFTYAYEMNVQDGSTTGGGPKRHLKFEVRVRLKIGPPSLAAEVVAFNEPIPAISPLVGSVSFESAIVTYQAPSWVPDFAGVRVYLSTVSPVAIEPSNLVYDGPNTAIALMALDFDTEYFVALGGYDTFGATDMQFGTTSFSTTMFDVDAIAAEMIGIDLLDATLRARIDLVDGDMPGSVNARILGEAQARGAAILSEQTARQEADESIASKTDTITASLAGIGSAAAQEAILAQVTAEGGLAAMVDALSVVVGNNHAAFLDEIEVLADNDSAQATQITTLTSTVNYKNRTFYQNGAPTTTVDYALVEGDVWIDTDDSNKYYRWSGSSWVYIANPEAIKNRTFAQTTQPTSTSDYTLQTGDLWVNTASNNRIYRWNGTAWAEVTDIRTGQNTTSIQVVSSTVDGLSGQYTVKIDNNGYVVGFGLASEAVEDYDNAGQPYWRMASTFEVVVDSFQVRSPGNGTEVPFAVGQHTDPVTGVTTTKVIMKKAMIENASIGTAHIVDGTITNAKIGNTIQSTNYSAGSAGWIINKNGTAEFGALVLRDWLSGSTSVPNNTPQSVTHNRGHIPIITVWSGDGNCALTNVTSTSFTVRLDNSGGGTVSYRLI